MKIYTVESLIEKVMDDGDIQSAIYALEDGEYLGSIGCDQQDVVEEAWDYLKSKVITAFQIYDAVFDNANDGCDDVSIENVQNYAYEVFDIQVSDELAEQIVATRKFVLLFPENFGNSDDFYWHIKKPLSEIWLQMSI